MSELKVGPACFCGASTSLRSNALIYNGKEYGNGKIWLCDRFPACRGSVGTHPDGRPLGIVPDEETKKLRIKLHAMIDPLWQNRTDRAKSRNRGSVYGWLKRIMGREIHMGETTKQDCLEIIEAIKNNPFHRIKIMPTNDSMLKAEEVFNEIPSYNSYSQREKAIRLIAETIDKAVMRERNLHTLHDDIFISHIQSHLQDGEVVVCKICGLSAKDIFDQVIGEFMENNR